jgi:translation initiation factor IF-3
MEVLIIAKLDHQLNEEIRDKEVRVIGADGAQLGIMTAAAANTMAEEQELDLVKISPNAVPPVCKIMDYSKFCYDQKKREKDAKKNQKVVEIKEIRMSPSIDTNDLNTKIKAAQKFLSDGNRVKVSIRFRGREMAHTNIGEKILLDFADACAEIASMEKNPKLEGRFMAMFLTPKNSK